MEVLQNLYFIFKKGKGAEISKLFLKHDRKIPLVF